MRDRTAAATLLVVAAVALGWLYVGTVDLPAEEAPEADFEVDGDPGEGELVVEFTGGDRLESGSLAVLVYEDRTLLPDRTVHRSTWEAEGAYIDDGDRLELEDPRLEPGQRLVVRYYGDDGQANLFETVL